MEELAGRDVGVKASAFAAAGQRLKPSLLPAAPGAVAGQLLESETAGGRVEANLSSEVVLGIGFLYKVAERSRPTPAGIQ